MYAVLSLPGFDNEYKFISTAAIAVTPFLCVGVERLAARLRTPRWLAPGLGVAATAALTAVGIEYLNMLMRPYDWEIQPALIHDGRTVRLGEGERFAAIADALRTNTPDDAVIAAGDLQIHLPAYAQRPVYAPFNGETKSPLLGIENNALLTKVKGYPRQLLRARQAVLTKLFAPESDATDRQDAIIEISALNRPIAVVTQKSADQMLEAWLRENSRTSVILESEDLSLWLVRP
jgi:hypothetical protein